MSRPGLSLTEVLVAMVLLAVGVAGAMGAISAALRMRNGALIRERVAAATADRLSWFERAGCAVNDTTIVVLDASGSGVAESWDVEPEPSAVWLRGESRSARAGVTFALRVETRSACE